VPLPPKLCQPFGAFSEDKGKGQDVALPVGGKWAPARRSMCEHTPCGRYLKKLHLTVKDLMSLGTLWVGLFMGQWVGMQSWT